MKNKHLIKITSFALVLSLLLALFTVYPFANESEDVTAKDDITVIYNRNYEDGWNYNNGMSTDSKYDLDASITYVKMSASWYNYYMNLKPTGDRGGYLGINLGKETPTSGKLFFEYDMKANADNNIGGIVMMAGMGKGTDRMLSHIVSMQDGYIYLLGEKANIVPTSWTTVKFEFDFDYAENNPDAGDDEFRVTAYYGEDTVKTRVYTAKSGFGISELFFGAQENLLGYDREGDEYFIDNVKVYYGCDDFTKIDGKGVGSAVDTNLPAEIKIQGVATSGGYLSGQLPIDRIDYTDDVKVYYNRYWSEGWGYNNGTTNNAERENDFVITSDYAAEVNKGESGILNYYLQFTQRNSQNGFIRIDGTTAVERTGKCYLEFDIKANVGATIPSIIEVITPKGASGSMIAFPAIYISDGNLFVLDTNVGQIGEEWCHVLIEMDFDYLSVDDPLTPENEATDPTAIKYTAYVGSEGKKVESVKNIAADGFKGIMNLRIGRGGGLGAGHEGDWWGMDNLQLYTAEGPTTIPDDVTGLLVKENWQQDIIIDSGLSAPNKAEILADSLAMKVNVNNALFRDEKIQLFTDEEGNAYGAPYFDEFGRVMVPLRPILDYMAVPYEFVSGELGCDIFIAGNYISLASGRNSTEIGGRVYKMVCAPVVKAFGANKVMYIALDDVENLFEGYYVTYDEVGLMWIARYDEFLNRTDDETAMQECAKKFIYTGSLDHDDFYNSVVAGTNNFTHPFILATQDKFDELSATYYSVPGDELFDEELIWYIDTQIDYADSYLVKYANFDDSGNYLGIKEGQWKYNEQGMASWVTTETEGNHSVSIMPYPDSGGYDPAGGRLNVLSDGETCLVAALEPAALAYQITRDEKYLVFAYDWMYALCQWEHWGPGHFLNAANTSRPLATAYDWLYNDFVRVYGQEKVDYLAKRIYENGVYEAKVSLNGLPPEHVRPNGADSSKYWKHIGNWNPCCTLGMLIASLNVMEHEEYREDATYVITESLMHYMERGMTYVTFDGGYRESAGYWACVRFMHFIHQILIDTTGSDFGLTDFPGIDVTDYFGCHVEGSDYDRWNYHDDWNGTQPSYWYYLSAKMFDNPEYAAIRYTHIHSGDSGKVPFRYDVIFYDKEVIENMGEANLSLDFVMTSIDAILSRSSWESGALYVGMMGGGNDVAHGQYDSGNWIYENEGVRWFIDLGADDYNLYGGGLAQGYYKYSAEGNNTLAIASQPDTIPHGQTKNGWGELVSSVVNEYGTATVIDQQSVYGGKTTYAYRGMLMTNDRKTVVIQDEVSLINAQDMYWFAHFNSSQVDVTLLDRDRTAIMTSKGKTLRVSLLTPDRLLKFQIWDCESEDKLVLETPLPGYSASMNGIAEGSRKSYKRLVIQALGVISFDVAVVIEMIDPDQPVELGYNLGWGGNPAALQPMSTWIPSADTRTGVGDAIGGDEETRPKPSIYTVISNKSIFEKYLTENTYLGSEKENFFRLLCDVNYIIEKLGRDKINTNDADIAAALETFDNAKAAYDSYHDKVEAATTSASAIAKGLVGIK